MFDFENTAGPVTESSLLSVSGGGLLGVIPAAMLLRIEALGKEKYGPHYRLSDSFDSVSAGFGAVFVLLLPL